MKNFSIQLLILAVALGAAACGGARKGAGQTTAETPNPASPRHATGFDVELREGFTLLSVHDPQDESGGRTTFALVPRGTSPEGLAGLPGDVQRLDVPVRSAVCMTTLQLSNFIALGRTDAVVGITSTRHLFNPDVNARLRDGRTKKIGIEGNFDPETIIGLAPDIILISPYKRGGYDAIREVGIPLLPHFGYQETTPLGQAEWIKCVGELLGCRPLADSLFAGIEARYEELKALAADVETRPTVLSGEMRSGNWYAVGGQSYLACLFRDAGADYFLKDNESAGGVTMDFESVYAAAAEVDYWRILNSFEGEFSYDALRGQDGRYADFRAWSRRGIIYCNMRTVPFYENTPVEPDVVLADFIRAFHPEIVPEHNPVYYKLLR